MSSSNKGKTTERANKVSETPTDHQDDEKVAFDAAMSTLIKHLVRVMEAREELKIKVGVVSPVLKYLRRYQTVYEKTAKDDPLEHVDYIKPWYRKFRTLILKGDNDWLTKNSITIQYGYGTPAESRAKDYRIMLSTIYNAALQMKDDKEKQLEGCPDEDWAQAHELNFPDIILLYLYRIFVIVADTEEDREKLRGHVRHLEDELQIPHDSTPEVSGISGFVGAATQMIGKLGIKPPPGQRMPTEKEVTGLFENVFKNEKTQSAIGQLVGSVQNSKDIGELMENLLKGFKDSELTETIAQTIGQTAVSAESSASKLPTTSGTSSSEGPSVELSTSCDDDVCVPTLPPNANQ